MALVRTLLACLAATCLPVLAAATSADELETNWRDYLSASPHPQPVLRFPHASCFAAASAEHELPMSLLLAVARGESDFDVMARSRANAHGIMQILWPTTARHLGIHRLSQLYEPCTNIDAGARYLRELLGHYDGNLHLALAAYNYGPNRIARDGRNIPRGANWYSGYIYRHLRYVIGKGPGRPAVDADLYSALGQTTLLTFGEPYRAAAFITELEEHAPTLGLDWFRRGTGEFEVVLTYADRDEFESAAGQLARAGFPLAD